MVKTKGEYEVSIVRDRDQFRLLLPEWRDLLARGTLRGEFVNDPAVIDLELAMGAVAPHVVLVRRDGELQCIAPFSIRSAKLPIQFSVYTLARYPLQLLNLYGTDFIFAAGTDTRACCALACDAIQDAPFDLGVLYALDSRGELWRYFHSLNGMPRRIRFVRPDHQCDKCFQIELPATFAEYMASLSSSTRSSLRRRSKKLHSQRAAQLRKVASPYEVEMFLSCVENIYRDTWQAKTYGQIQRDRPSEVERLKSIAREGWLRCYLLESDQGPMAFQIGYQYHDTYYACDFAFARRWAELGPGAVLMFLMMEDLCTEDSPQIVDLGAGDSPQKHTFRGSAFDVGDYWVIPRNRWRYVALTQRYLTRVESSVRSLLVRTKVDVAVRRMLKHKD